MSEYPGYPHPSDVILNCVVPGLAYLGMSGTLAALSSMSRTFHNNITPILYDSVSLTTGFWTVGCTSLCCDVWVKESDINKALDERMTLDQIAMDRRRLSLPLMLQPATHSIRSVHLVIKLENDLLILIPSKSFGFFFSQRADVDNRRSRNTVTILYTPLQHMPSSRDLLLQVSTREKRVLHAGVPKSLLLFRKITRPHDRFLRSSL